MISRNIAVILSGRDAGLARTLGAAAGALHAFDSAVEGANRKSAALAAGLKLGLAALAVALAVGLGAAVKSAVDFEMAMRNVNTVAHATEPELQAMSNAVLGLSTRLPQSAQTLADGLYNIASSGFYGADALRVLEVSATAASAGITETNVASRAIVSVLNAYGLSAEHAADVSDVLFKTVELGVLTFEELATQLGDVVAGAALAGVEIDEVGAAIATMTLSGLSAAEATVSLNRLLREIINPGEALSKAFSNLGYESGLAALEARGLHGVMEALRIVTGGNVLEIQKLFPEIRAGRAAFALMAAGGETYRRIQAQITDEQSRAGATQRAFNEQMKATGNQFILLGNQIKAVGIEIGTALLPALNAVMDWMRRVGPQIGDFLVNAWNQAQPAIRAVGRAIESVVELLQEFWQAAQPVVQIMAQFVFGAAIAGLMGLANALSAVANFLSDHPALVQAIALVWGGALVTRLLVAAAAFLRVQAGLLAIRAGLAALAVPQIVALGVALGQLVRGNTVGAMLAFQGAITGVGRALGGLAIGASTIAGLYLIQKTFDDASDSADKLHRSVTKGFDTSTLSGLQGSVSSMKDELARLDEEWNNMVGTGNRVTTVIRGVFETFTPLPNKIAENTAETNKLRDAMAEEQEKALIWSHDLATLSNELGLSEAAVQGFLEQLDYDPLDFATTTSDLADKIRVLALEATYAGPAAEGMAAALDAVGDPATTAADRVEAFNNAIDGLIGTMLSAFDATTAFHQALADLGTAVSEAGGFNLDPTSEAGRKVRDAFSEAAGAAVEMAKAEANVSGSVAEGLRVLYANREALIAQVEGYTGSREAAEEYVNQLGLTPEVLSTLVKLQGAEEAMFTTDNYLALINAVNQAVISPTVEIDSADFDNDAIKIGIALSQIEMANPEATVMLDGAPFQATAEQVQAWAIQWEAESPEAQALLSIIDPEGKFNTLQEAAENWDSQSPTAEASVDASQAQAAIAEVFGYLGLWDSSSGTADANADASQTRAEIFDSIQRLLGWDSSTGTSSVNADGSNAFGTMSDAEFGLHDWDASSGTADVNANDNASGKLSFVSNLLSFIDGYVATATVNVHTVGDISGAAKALRATGRYGYIDERMQSGGVLEATVVASPTVLFGERATGGEAFIPRRGNINRARTILAKAAAWYDMEMRPEGERPVAGSTFQFMTTVNMRVEPGVDPNAFERAVGKAVAKENKEMLREFRQVLVARGR